MHNHGRTGRCRSCQSRPRDAHARLPRPWPSIPIGRISDEALSSAVRSLPVPTLTPNHHHRRRRPRRRWRDCAQESGLTTTTTLAWPSAVASIDIDRPDGAPALPEMAWRRAGRVGRRVSPCLPPLSVGYYPAQMRRRTRSLARMRLRVTLAFHLSLRSNRRPITISREATPLHVAVLAAVPKWQVLGHNTPNPLPRVMTKTAWGGRWDADI